ncbi:uncharacterized protein LOC144317207 isoform X4 [Canis aureus]
MGEDGAARTHRGAFSRGLRQRSARVPHQGLVEEVSILRSDTVALYTAEHWKYLQELESARGRGTHGSGCIPKALSKGHHWI